VLIFETNEEGIKLLSNLTPELYQQMPQHIIEYFNGVKNYDNFKVNSDSILELVN